MKKQEILKRLTEWQKVMIGMDVQLEKLADLFGRTDDGSPLINQIRLMQECYTDSVHDLVGCRGEWLRTWWHDLGFNGSVLNYEVEGVEFPARSLDDLATIIEADR